MYDEAAEDIFDEAGAYDNHRVMAVYVIAVTLHAFSYSLDGS